MLHHPRPALAKRLAQGMRGQDVFGDAHNGLFLAAPRRTGKSTFLQSDLKPELERQGMVVVYVDLWSDQRRDPGALVAEAIGRTLDARRGPVARIIMQRVYFHRAPALFQPPPQSQETTAWHA